MVGLIEEVSSSMVLESRSCVQFPSATQFFTAHIPSSLTSAEPAGITAPEQEQSAPTTTARTHEGECLTIA
jgi:hypothetical protein